jgi:hypothetical protein
MDQKIINYAKSKNIILTEDALVCLNLNNYACIVDELCKTNYFKFGGNRLYC